MREIAAEGRALGGRVLIRDLGTAPADGVPRWVRVSVRIIAARCREYAEQTGHAPSRQLLEDFMRAGREALEEHLKDPLRVPFQPMTLLDYEREKKWRTGGKRA